MEGIRHRIQQSKTFSFASSSSTLRRGGSIIVTEVEKDAPDSIRIPPWSVEDRFQRSLVQIGWLKLLACSNWTVALPYLVVLWAVRFWKYEERLSYLPYVILISMGCHAVVIFLRAIPHIAYDNTMIDRRVNASIFIAMVLYTYVGLWSLEQTISFDAFWVLRDGDEFSWGPIFFILIYSIVAVELIRDSTWDFHKEVSEVMTNTDDPQKSSTALFTVLPNRKDRLTAYLCRLLTASLWHLLPQKSKPSAYGGKFLFQLVSPMCLLMFYLGTRLLIHAIESLSILYSRWDEYLVEPCPVDGARELEVHVLIWGVFVLISTVMRGLLTNPVFLSMTVPDKHMRAARKQSWVRVNCQSKRKRVLWASRGAVLAFVRLQICQHGYPEKMFASGLLWYLYMGVFYSFAAEGILVILLGFREAERATRLNTPTEVIIRHVSWLSYNSFCQPVGSVINLLFYFVNCEFRAHAPMTEFWGPLINSQNDFRHWVKKFGYSFFSWSDRREFADLYVKAQLYVDRAKRKAGQETLCTPTEDFMDMWADRLNRMRAAAGRGDSVIDVVKQPSRPPPDVPFTVFRGSVFPERSVWRHMRQNSEKFVPLLPWERNAGNTCVDAKFQLWYPSCKEEIVALLSEKYEFSKSYEVWMFGIGSIMSPDLPPSGLTSRQMKLMIPYWMHADAGYRRVWNYRHGTCCLTALGLQKSDPGETFCGCVYPIGYEKACELFGQREEGYELMLVHEDYFKPMHPDLRMPKGVGYIWMCGQPVSHCLSPWNDACPRSACKRHRPTQDAPIVQSYVDVVMRGLVLKYRTPGAGHADGMRFAAAFAQTTHGWDAPWSNDRLVVGRPWSFNPAYDIIDGLLSTCPTSKAAFLRRQNPSMRCLTTMQGVLADERNHYAQWAQHFFGSTMSWIAEEKDIDKEASDKAAGFALGSQAQGQSVEELTSLVKTLSAQVGQLRAEMTGQVGQVRTQLRDVRAFMKLGPEEI